MYEKFWEEIDGSSDTCSETFGTFNLQLFQQKQNDTYQIVKELSSETWFLCTNNIKITYIPIHMYEEFCFDYTSSTTLRWRVYKTEDAYVAFCVSQINQKQMDFIDYNSSCKLLTRNIGYFLILNRSFQTYNEQLQHKMSFIEEIGHGPVDTNIYHFISSLPSIYDIYKHYPPHYLHIL